MLPKVTTSRTARLDPNRVVPATEIADPIRAMPRKLNELPRTVKSSTDRQDLTRVWPKTLIPLPMQPKLRKASELPS